MLIMYHTSLKASPAIQESLQHMALALCKENVAGVEGFNLQAFDSTFRMVCQADSNVLS